MKIMAEEYIAESGTHAVDFDGMEEEIMRTFERLCKEPSDSAVVQLAAVVERLFERTRRAEEHLHADPEEFAAMRHQLETLKQQVQDLQTELRTVKENHELLLEISETEWKKQTSLIQKDYEKAAAENARMTEDKELLLGHIAELEATGRRNESSIRAYVVEIQNIEEELRNAKEDLQALRQANLDRTWPSPADESFLTDAEADTDAIEENRPELAAAENTFSSTSAAENTVSSTLAAEKWTVNPETILEIGVMDASSSNIWNGDLSDVDVIAPPMGESLAAELRTMFPGTVGDCFFPKRTESAKWKSSSDRLPVRNTPGDAFVPLCGTSTKATSPQLIHKKHRRVNWSISALFLVYGLFGVYFLLNWLSERIFGVGLLRISKPA